MYIDSHVHLRDGPQSEKETIKHGLKVAKKAGVDAVFDIGYVTTRKGIEERFELADKANSRVFYGQYICLTSDMNQVEKAVELYNEFFPKPGDKMGVIGLKLFAGRENLVTLLQGESPINQIKKCIQDSTQQGLDQWPKFINKLKSLGVSQKRIEDLTFNNIIKLFKIPEGVIKRTSNKGKLNLNEYKSVSPYEVLSVFARS